MDEFKLDDQVNRIPDTNSHIPDDATGVILGPSFEDYFGDGILYPVKWFGYPLIMSMRHNNCPLSDCKTRDHWHSRARVLIKVTE